MLPLSYPCQSKTAPWQPLSICRHCESKLPQNDSEMAGHAEWTSATPHLCPGNDFVPRGTAPENGLVGGFQGVRRHFLGLFGLATPLFYVHVASPVEPTPLWFGACSVLVPKAKEQKSNDHSRQNCDSGKTFPRK